MQWAEETERSAAVAAESKEKMKSYFYNDEGKNKNKFFFKDYIWKH